MNVDVILEIECRLDIAIYGWGRKVCKTCGSWRFIDGCLLVYNHVPSVQERHGLRTIVEFMSLNQCS